MALLTCPDCGGNVSSKAAKCPRCGCPVSVMIQEQQNSEMKQAPEPQNEVLVQNTGSESPTIEQKQAVVPEPTTIESTQTVESKPTTIEHKRKTESTNSDVKWSQGALIGGALIAVIVVIVIVFFYKKSSDTDYTSQYKSNDETITVNGVSFQMIKVDGGSFNMGSNDSDAYDDEKPVHRVTLNDFYIGETEVTQGLWYAVMGTNPSYFCNGDNCPVEGVSWNECQQFIQMLNAKTGKKFSLPTEAQWEYAALGGRKSLGYKYSGNNSISTVGWYDSNSNDATHYVKALSANELGLYDMTGNVYEWCQDWYADRYDSNNSLTDPIGPISGTLRVVRSGSWKSKSRNCRVAYRFKYAPDYNFRNLGFRLCINTTTSHNYTKSTSSFNAAPVKIQNPAVATQRLYDFKRKITSSPFEKDAIKCLKTIDNEYAKCAFFLGNITQEDDGDFDYTYGCIYLYNAVNDQLFRLDGDKFIKSNINDVSKKMLGWRFDDNNEDNRCHNGYFLVKDYSNKGVCVIQFGNVGDDKIIRLTMSDLHVQSFSTGEILQDKYLVEFDRWGPTVGPLDTRIIKQVSDLFTGKEIENPFTKAGAVNFIGENNTKINLFINNDASVTGNVLYNGKTYKVNKGNQTFDGDINLSIGYTDDGIDCFIIKKEGNKYILLGGFSDVYDIEEKFSMEVFKQ